ncbi:hypothetical protein MWH25_10405 [Natroniella acetigena]|uniref:hypothetical protein n=1 Tax=Natroniella acetigena TaxID=52004 RepID=UPI00200B8793|nr:hypothetical protein [Natroniella acetigena]MCK8828142.1 hypothetical protein [Natroniella acetigena]
MSREQIKAKIKELEELIETSRKEEPVTGYEERLNLMFDKLDLVSQLHEKGLMEGEKVKNLESEVNALNSLINDLVQEKDSVLHSNLENFEESNKLDKKIEKLNKKKWEVVEQLDKLEYDIVWELKYKTDQSQELIKKFESREKLELFIDDVYINKVQIYVEGQPVY